MIPVIVSCALFMQQLDSTAVATALPAMSRSLHVSTLGLHVAITSYLFALAVFLPLAGWTSDRFGQRKVFCWAIAIFTLGSIFSALAADLTALVVARVVQGLGGALMVPVARIILAQSVEKSELISALAVMGMTAVVGPIVGPLLGGAMTTFATWRWIFWINVPVGMAGVVLTRIFIPEARGEAPKAFDLRGFVLTTIGLGCFMYWADATSQAHGANLASDGALLAAFLALALYVVHSRRAKDPLLDLNVLANRTFSISLLGGSLFRVGFGALPFLLSLLMQQQFGYSPLQSGAITFVSAIGSFGMRANVGRILRRFGFRRVLVINALVSNAFMALCAAFSPATPRLFMMSVLLLGGVFRALQFTSLNALSIADVERAHIGGATTLSQIGQRVSQSLGVTLSAFLLTLLSGHHRPAPLTAFAGTFLLVAAIASLSSGILLFLPPGAGAELTNSPAGAEAALVEDPQRRAT